MIRLSILPPIDTYPPEYIFRRIFSFLDHLDIEEVFQRKYSGMISGQVSGF